MSRQERSARRMFWLGIVCLGLGILHGVNHWESDAYLSGALTVVGLVFAVDGLRDIQMRRRRALDPGVGIAWRTPAGELKRGFVTGKRWVPTMGEYRISVNERGSGFSWQVWEHDLA